MQVDKFKRANNQAILWVDHHLDCLRASFKRNLENPVAYFFTIAMIAIVLIIPFGLYIFYSSSQQLTQQWDSDKQITLFLKDSIVISQAQILANQLLNKPSVSQTTVVNKQQALEDFKQQMGLDGLATQLPDNPLPHLIIIHPHAELTDIKSLRTLESELQQLEQVQQVQFDLLWFQRLQGILSIISQTLWLVSIILFFAIGIIIANVVRWEVSSRHAEIEIIKLVGASDAYVKRPFLYSGLWLGLGGSLLAIIITHVSTLLLQQRAKQLAALFDGQVTIATISANQTLMILLTISVLGVAASWLAVTQKLRQYP